MCPAQCVLRMASIPLQRSKVYCASCTVVLPGGILEVCADSVEFCGNFSTRRAFECSGTVCRLHNSAAGARSLSKDRQFINL